MNLEKELILSKDLALKAAALIMTVYARGDLRVTYKDNASPLTIADKKANDLIVAGLKGRFPDYAILAEESRDDASRLDNKWCWIVDPLDGTKEFVKRIPEFTVNIALACEQRVVLGVICVPVTGDLYWANKDQGAYYQAVDAEPKSIQVSGLTDKTTLRLVMSRSHASEKLQALIDRYQISRIKRSGSSIKGCLVAQGAAEVYYRFNPTMEWDTAAMQCIVEEAGGIFRQMDDSEMRYNRENSLNDKGFYVLNKVENKLH
ncbi:MAG: 3'(2'),5'-bisphosphate nucleotidase CysQ [Candidatus Omnitrophica bacterium]|nr:3'(2'),5'-bisphosphate nucleotidase CysQ [Candidatus Omnitrophota bacterium]